jgi:hypothetical protein
MNNMSELNKFLKVMNKMGYPNPNTKSIARSMDYDLDEFLPNLVEEVGEERAEEFTENALSKLNEDGKFVDEEFPPISSSLIKNWNNFNQEDCKDWDKYQWKRLSDIEEVNKDGQICVF